MELGGLQKVANLGRLSCYPVLITQWKFSGIAKQPETRFRAINLCEMLSDIHRALQSEFTKVIFVELPLS